MEKTLTKVCEYLNNYFWRTKIEGKFVIEDGSIEVTSLKEGQYFRILGSDLNDGVYVYPATDLKDEEFEGAIWSMAVPQTVIDLLPQIEEWESLYGSASSPALSPFNSESFGNYSYSKGSASSGVSNGFATAFGAKLAPFRRLRNI